MRTDLCKMDRMLNLSPFATRWGKKDRLAAYRRGHDSIALWSAGSFLLRPSLRINADYYCGSGAQLMTGPTGTLRESQSLILQPHTGASPMSRAGFSWTVQSLFHRSNGRIGLFGLTAEVLPSDGCTRKSHSGPWLGRASRIDDPSSGWDAAPFANGSSPITQPEVCFLIEYTGPGTDLGSGGLSRFSTLRRFGRLGFLRTTSLQIAHLRQRVFMRKVFRVFVITARITVRAPMGACHARRSVAVTAQLQAPIGDAVRTICCYAPPPALRPLSRAYAPAIVAVWRVAARLPANAGAAVQLDHARQFPRHKPGLPPTLNRAVLVNDLAKPHVDW